MHRELNDTVVVLWLVTIDQVEVVSDLPSLLRAVGGVPAVLESIEAFDDLGFELGTYFVQASLFKGKMQFSSLFFKF